MNKKLWQTEASNLHPLIERYTVGDDYLTDLELLPYDIKASKAHAKMLCSIGILNEKELENITIELESLSDKVQKGAFKIEKHQEDGHTAIEHFLTERLGETGKKIHTGRSRNDQSLVMIRLFMKDKLNEIHKLNSSLIDALKTKAKEEQGTAMPGYTHMQKAMPTTVNTWLLAYKELLVDFQNMTETTQHIIDKNPLGSSSGFGIENFDLDRSITTKALAFKTIQENPIYCGLSRGYFENIVLQTIQQPIVVASKFANDMLLFTTQEFHFFSLPKTFTTGSSIMPQKRNYDVFEIMRGNVKVMTSYQRQIQDIVATIGSGYQRDLQLTKKPFIQGIHLCILTLKVLEDVVKNLKVNHSVLQKAMTKDLYVTNDVYELVKQGKSFRDAYIEIKEKWNTEG